MLPKSSDNDADLTNSSSFIYIACLRSGSVSVACKL